MVSFSDVMCPMSLDNKHPVTVSSIPEEQRCQLHLTESVETCYTFLIWGTNMIEISALFFLCDTYALYGTVSLIHCPQGLLVI